MNRRVPLFGLVYLLLALALDFGVLGVLAGDLPSWLQLTQLRLTALGVILAGLIRSKYEALVYAWFCALLAGSIAGPGYLGATLTSYTLATMIGCAVAHVFRVEHVAIRWGLLLMLILVESGSNSLIHRWVEPRMALEIQWPAHLVGSLIGLAVYKLAAPHIIYLPKPGARIGRKPVARR